LSGQPSGGATQSPATVVIDLTAPTRTPEPETRLKAVNI
jgi:hypothetical protein